MLNEKEKLKTFNGNLGSALSGDLRGLVLSLKGKNQQQNLSGLKALIETLQSINKNKHHNI